jgi:hypothetical protein
MADKNSNKCNIWIAKNALGMVISEYDYDEGRGCVSIYTRPKIGSKWYIAARYFGSDPGEQYGRLSKVDNKARIVVLYDKANKAVKYRLLTGSHSDIGDIATGQSDVTDFHIEHMYKNKQPVIVISIVYRAEVIVTYSFDSGTSTWVVQGSALLA